MTSFGNVCLSALYEAGYPVVPYVNAHEHPGSISLVMVPAVITHVQTLAVPIGLGVKNPPVPEKPSPPTPLNGRLWTRGDHPPRESVDLST